MSPMVEKGSSGPRRPHARDGPLRQGRDGSHVTTGCIGRGDAAIRPRLRQAGCMSREIPQAIRAVAGLAATVLDEARRLPQTLPALPVRVIGLAMQVTMKLQQHYVGLVARGDEVFTGMRGEDEPG